MCSTQWCLKCGFGLVKPECLLRLRRHSISSYTQSLNLDSRWGSTSAVVRLPEVGVICLFLLHLSLYRLFSCLICSVAKQLVSSTGQHLHMSSGYKKHFYWGRKSYKSIETHIWTNWVCIMFGNDNVIILTELFYVKCLQYGLVLSKCFMTLSSLVYKMSLFRRWLYHTT